jgi:hypothetical protein
LLPASVPCCGQRVVARGLHGAMVDSAGCTAAKCAEDSYSTHPSVGVCAMCSH